jgi:hypothetical protein
MEPARVTCHRKRIRAARQENAPDEGNFTRAQPQAEAAEQWPVSRRDIAERRTLSGVSQAGKWQTDVKRRDPRSST